MYRWCSVFPVAAELLVCGMKSPDVCLVVRITRVRWHQLRNVGFGPRRVMYLLGIHLCRQRAGLKLCQLWQDNRVRIVTATYRPLPFIVQRCLEVTAAVDHKTTDIAYLLYHVRIYMAENLFCYNISSSCVYTKYPFCAWMHCVFDLTLRPKLSWHFI